MINVETYYKAKKLCEKDMKRDSILDHNKGFDSFVHRLSRSLYL